MESLVKISGSFYKSGLKSRTKSKKDLNNLLLAFSLISSSGNILLPCDRGIHFSHSVNVYWALISIRPLIPKMTWPQGPYGPKSCHLLGLTLCQHYYKALFTCITHLILTTTLRRRSYTHWHMRTLKFKIRHHTTWKL